MAFDDRRKQVAIKRHKSTEDFILHNWKEDTAYDLQNGALNLLENDIMTDITLLVEEKEFRCHKVILAAVSPYFRAMFSGGFREENESIIHLKGMSAVKFEVVLNFIYSKSNDVTLKNVIGILKIAHMLQMKCLQIECERFITDHLSDKNAIKMWNAATNMSWKNLEEYLRQYVMRNFIKISQDFSFATLNPHEMIKLISSDELNTPSEEHVYQAVINWLNYKEKDRIPFIADILQHVRFPLMKAETLIELKSQFSHIFEDRQCDSFLTEACQYHMITARKHEMWSKRTQHRICSPYANVCIAVCETGYGTKFVAFDFVTQIWKEIRITEQNTSLHSFQISSNVFSNGEHISCLSKSRFSFCHMHVLDFDLPKQKVTITKLKENRTNCSVVVVGGALIFIGGIKACSSRPQTIETSVVKYDFSRGIKKNREKIGDILVPVLDMSTAIIGNDIYLFGGKTESGDESTVVQGFDTMTNQWFRVGELPEPISYSRSVIVDDTVYVFSKSGTVMELKLFPNYSAKILGKYINFDFEKFAVLFRDDNFWVFNCHDSTNETHTRWIRVMERETGQEITLTKLPKQISENYTKIVDIIPFVIPKGAIFTNE